MQLQHFLLKNKANIKYTCKSQLYIFEQKKKKKNEDLKWGKPLKQ